MLKHKQITEKIIKCFYEVFNELGNGFLESVYENSLVIALREYGLKVEQQKDIKVYFREQLVGDFRVDLYIDEKVVVEIKAVSSITSAHQAQIINYLKATKTEVGLLINFGKKPEFKRFVFEKKGIIRENPCKSVAKKTKPRIGADKD